MSKKYIITIKSEYEDITRGIMVLGARDSNLFVDTVTLDDLEELNSDYINEHFGDLQGKAYQQGLDDAWEAARKIVLSPDEGGTSLTDIYVMFGNNGSMQRVFRSYSASEVIEKLKVCEKKQKAAEEIKVGDVVERYINGKFDSTGIYLGEDGDYWNCLFWTGAVFSTFAYPKNQFKKTGIHLGIDKIMEEEK